MARVILLRSLEQIEETKKKLLSLNHEVIVCPLIEIIPIQENIQKINAEFLKPFTTLAFTSQNSVKYFFLNSQDIAQKKVVAVGIKTKEALEKKGINVHFIPSKFAAENLFNSLSKEERILFPCVEDLAYDPPNPVTKLPLYRNQIPKFESFTLREGDCVFFTSSSTADRFFNSSLYRGEPIISFCIGEKTLSTVTKYIQKNVYLAKDGTTISMIESLQCYKDKQ